MRATPTRGAYLATASRLLSVPLTRKRVTVYLRFDGQLTAIAVRVEQSEKTIVAKLMLGIVATARHLSDRTEHKTVAVTVQPA